MMDSYGNFCVYVPLDFFYGFHVGKYTSPMKPMVKITGCRFELCCYYISLLSGEAYVFFFYEMNVRVIVFFQASQFGKVGELP